MTKDLLKAWVNSGWRRPTVSCQPGWPMVMRNDSLVDIHQGEEGGGVGGTCL